MTHSFSGSSEERPKIFGELNSQYIADFYKSSDFMKAEVSSAGIQANARGCANLASIMANKGQNLMSRKSWKIMHSEPKSAIFGDTPGNVSNILTKSFEFANFKF